MATTDTQALRRTVLYDEHVKLKGQIIPFAGWEMPVRYSSDLEEHLCVREKVGIFDVSHMGEFLIKGPSALALIQKVTTNDASKLTPGKAQYSCFPNHYVISFGGIWSRKDD